MPDSVEIWFNELYNQKLDSERAEKVVENFKDIIVTGFQDIATDKDLIWENFLNLQTNLYLWMELHGLERDFIFENSYTFFYQLSQNEHLPIQDLRIWGRIFPRRLQSYEFEFPKQEGWWARNERAEDYQKRIIKEFKNALIQYLYSSYNYLDLANKKHITKPKDPDFESIYWLIGWNEGATCPQIAKCFNRSADTIKDGINALKRFALPKRNDKPGRKGKDLPVSEERVRAIRQQFLEAKETKKNKQGKNLSKKI